MPQETRLLALAGAIGADIRADRRRISALEPAAITLGYDGAGRLSTVTRADGVVRTLGYSPSGRLSTVVTSSPGSPTVTRTLVYSPSGAITGVTIS